MRELTSEELEDVSGAGFWSELGAGIDWVVQNPFTALGFALDSTGAGCFCHSYTYEANGIQNIK
jgi:hypothetical protein